MLEPTELVCEPVLEEAPGVLLELDGVCEDWLLVLEPTELVCEPVLEASGVELVEEELDGVCEDWLLMSEELLLGEGLEEAAPGVLLVEDDDCEDCDPHLLEEAELSGEVLEGEVALEELLDCGLLLEVESGVEVLPVAPVVLCALELLPTLLLEPVCALLLAEVSGVEDCDELGLVELEPV